MLGRASARPKLTEPAGFATPARADLALAIATLKVATDGAVRLQDGVNDLARRADAARTARWRADEAVQQAIENAPAHLAASIMGTVPDGAPAPMTPKAAREALDEATDTERELNAALELLRPELASALASPGYRRKDAIAAAKVVLRDEAVAVAVELGAEVVRLRDTLAQRTALLRWMVGNDMHPPHDNERLRHAVEGRAPEHLDPSDAEVCAPWRNALNSLLADANAPLPGGA